MRLGWDAERWFDLRRRSPAFREWSDAIAPIVRDCTELVAIDEGLRRWRSTRLQRPLRVDGHGFLGKHVIGITTPPARPEWLTLLGDIPHKIPAAAPGPCGINPTERARA